jgi:SAM-dependent methyltransferase
MDILVNTEQADAWNGYEGEHWAGHAARWDRIVGGMNDGLFAAAAIGERARVLDVGCGTGQTTRLAARAAVHGHAVGVDLSAPMLARARATAAAEGLPNVRYEQGDAQVHPFAAEAFDVVTSRGGIMFFADPIAAFTNIRRALRPGGRLAFLCPRAMGDNEWFTTPITAVLGHEPALPAGAPYAPGMFSLSDPDRLDDVLTRAGFGSISAEPVDTLMHYGHDATDVTEFLLGTGPVRHQLRDAEGPAVAAARDRLLAALRPFERPDGVRLRGAWWVVTAARG